VLTLREPLRAGFGVLIEFGSFPRSSSSLLHAALLLPEDENHEIAWYATESNLEAGWRRWQRRRQHELVVRTAAPRSSVLLKDYATAPLCVVMSWHVLPSIGLIVIGVAGMGALQMGVHKLFHGKVLRQSLPSLFFTANGLTWLDRKRRIL
jgi:hypothetical protein